MTDYHNARASGNINSGGRDGRGSMQYVEVVRSRKSVREFADRPVEQEKLDYVLECARLAPSWANKQCWDFVVVSEPALLERVVAASPNKWLADAPTIIVCCGTPTRSGSKRDIPYWAADVAIATEQLVLAATDIGLGTCWVGIFDQGAVRVALDIPFDVQILALAPLGYPAENRAPRPDVSHGRRALDEIAHWNGW